MKKFSFILYFKDARDYYCRSKYGVQCCAEDCKEAEQFVGKTLSEINSVLKDKRMTNYYERYTVEEDKLSIKPKKPFYIRYKENKSNIIWDETVLAESLLKAIEKFEENHLHTNHEIVLVKED